MKVDRLEDPLIRRLEIQPKQYDVFETSFRGASFGVRVSPAGRKTFCLLYRNRQRQQRRLSLGIYPAVSLAEARRAAREALAEVVMGEDPAEKKQVKRRVPTFGEVFEEYLERYAKPRKRSWREDRRMGDRDVLPEWKDTPIDEIRRRDVIELLDSIADRPAGILANRVRALLSKVFNFAIDRDLLDANPVSRVPRPAKEQPRDRVLQHEEIRKVWIAMDKAPLLTGASFKLMLLTGQRGVEIRSMRWDDIDTKTNVWTIPAEVSKNGRANRLPLSRQVRALLDEIREVTGDCEYVFPGRSRNDYISYRGTYVTVLRRKSGVVFRPHDLRRTVATYMEDDLDVPRTIVDRVLNHVDSSVTGKHYSRGDKLVQTREALQRWADHLDKIVAEKSEGKDEKEVKGAKGH